MKYIWFRRPKQERKTYQDIVTPSEWILENGLWAVLDQTQISKRREYPIKWKNKNLQICITVQVRVGGGDKRCGK